jgi:hypothetical protein
MELLERPRNQRTKEFLGKIGDFSGLKREKSQAG